jgi:hypothetical protein
MREPGEAEERRGRSSQRHLYGAKALLDLLAHLRLGQLLAVEMRVRPGVRADGVTGGRNLLEDFRMIHGVLADREEQSLGAFVGKRLEHRGRGRPWAIVEGQHHFLVGQEIELLVLQEAEAGAAGGVDHDGAADAERIGIGAGHRSPRLGCGNGRGGRLRERSRSLDVVLQRKLCRGRRR